MDYIAVLVSIMVVSVLWYLYVQNIKKAARQYREAAQQYHDKNETLDTQLKDYSKQVGDLKVEKASLAASLKAKEEQATNTKNISAEVAQQLADKLTHEHRENQKLYSKDRNDTLKTFKEDLERFGTTIRETNSKTLEGQGKLKGQIESLTTLNKEITEETKNLTQALKGSSKTRGDWGEMILEKLLEDSGLEKGREYFTQQNFKDEEGKDKRPDAIITLPENRCIIIDSKVNLNDYVRYTELENEGQHEEAEEALRQHINSMKKHIKELSEKNYPSLTQELSLDYTFMFIPIEPAYLSVLKREMETILHEASRKQITLVSPSTLLAILHTVYNLWKIAKQNQHAGRIAEEGGKMYDKLCSFLENFRKIKTALNSAGKVYDEAEIQLKDGRGNLIKRAEDMKKLGAQTKKTLPPSFTQANETPTDELPAHSNASIPSLSAPTAPNNTIHFPETKKGPIEEASTYDESL